MLPRSALLETGRCCEPDTCCSEGPAEGAQAGVWVWGRLPCEGQQEELWLPGEQSERVLLGLLGPAGTAGMKQAVTWSGSYFGASLCEL